MNKLKLLTLAALCAASSLYAQVDTPSLQQVTTKGNTTDKGIKITGTNISFPNGRGLELFGDPTRGVGYIQYFDRGASNPYLPVNIVTPVFSATGRALINGATDDNANALQVAGGVRITNTLWMNKNHGVIIKENPGGSFASENILSTGWDNDLNQDWTELGVAGALANVAQLRVMRNGNVGIGTTKPQYTLAVNGTIGAKKVRVTQTGWPDFVFENDYQLLPLSELAKYIAQHKHLPDIPSAATVAKEGIDVGEMNKLLLQKVEELTLHLIEQQRQIADLNTRVQDMEKQRK